MHVYTVYGALIRELSRLGPAYLHVASATRALSTSSLLAFLSRQRSSIAAAIFGPISPLAPVSFRLAMNRARFSQNAYILAASSTAGDVSKR